jgi:hypothetical protein
MQWLNGKKTYIGLVAAGAVGLTKSLGWITPEVAAHCWPIIGAWTGVAIKHSFDKRGKKKT